MSLPRFLRFYNNYLSFAVQIQEMYESGLNNKEYQSRLNTLSNGFSRAWKSTWLFNDHDTFLGLATISEYPLIVY